MGPGEFQVPRCLYRGAEAAHKTTAAAGTDTRTHFAALCSLKTLLQVFLTPVHVLLLLTQAKAYSKILSLFLLMKQPNSKAFLQLWPSVPPH